MITFNFRIIYYIIPPLKFYIYNVSGLTSIYSSNQLHLMRTLTRPAEGGSERVWRGLRRGKDRPRGGGLGLNRWAKGPGD